VKQSFSSQPLPAIPAYSEVYSRIGKKIARRDSSPWPGDGLAAGEKRLLYVLNESLYGCRSGNTGERPFDQLMRALVSRLMLAASMWQVCIGARADGSTVELQILPSAFVVDGQSFQSATEAVATALRKHPDRIEVPSCAPMPTPRILEVLELFRNRFDGEIKLWIVAEGFRGCPKSAQARPKEAEN
jgi:hypothetical protein